MTGVPEPQGGWLEAGTAVTLDNCEREAIHLPGHVQAHGAILILDAADDHRVLQVSENVPALLRNGTVDGDRRSDDTDAGDHGAHALLGRYLAEVVGAEAAAAMLELPVDGPSVRPELITAAGVTLAAQAFIPAPGLLGIELEPAPPIPVTATITRYSSRVASMLTTAQDEDECVRVAVELLRQATGFDRVWAYRFEPDDHGVVVAEERDERLTSWLGLHFPKTDIPPQARAMYVARGLRLIGDSGTGDVPLVPELNPRTGERTDLTATDLRGVSPMHIRYLRNMGVRTSMSVPIVTDGRLWGLLSAHHYAGAHPVSVLVRGQCETLGLLTSMQLAAIRRTRAADAEAEAQRHLRDLATQFGGASSATDGLLADPDALLAACGADGVIVSLGDGIHTHGSVPAAVDVESLLRALHRRTDQEFADGELVASDSIAEIDESLATLAPEVAGVLAIRLSERHEHWVVWTRREQIERFTWANRDGGLVRRDPDGTLELGARESFERWAETVAGRSAPWSEADVEAAREVRAAIGTYAFRHALQVSERAAELARVNEELDAFAYSAAHDLRQPVRAIAMRASFLVEDLTDRALPDELESLHSITRLTDHMGSLVDSLLEYAKLDYAAHQPRRVHLGDVLGDVKELLAGVADTATITHDAAAVEADPEALRQVLFNLVWNAIKYNERQPVIHVGATKLSALPPEARAHATISADHDHDPDLVFVRDNGIGIPEDHLETIFGLFRRLHGTDDFGGGSGAGLALCRRLVQRSGGAIWATSVVGEGSTFYLSTTGTSAAA
ncbi:MAG: ATP-binding protein [Solirubrobacteraceae bacterium]|nr:ATP-binding protein [Solirubrobacteraceae bacterium]